MNKNVLITGGTRGIGEAISREFAKKGYNLIINYVNSKEKAVKLKNELEEKYNIDVLTIQADLADEKEIKNMVDIALNKFGKIDVLVNNAGITNNYNFIDITKEAYERVISTNLMSFLHMSHLVLPYMVNHSDKEHQCSIVNTSSVGGMTGVINQADYCAAKSGVIGLSRALALEFAKRGIRVNVIAPGMIMTDMLRGVNQDELRALASTIPEGYIGDVSDIAGALEYILKAPYLTGQVISPNGGFVLQ